MFLEIWRPRPHLPTTEYYLRGEKFFRSAIFSKLNFDLKVKNTHFIIFQIKDYYEFIFLFTLTVTQLNSILKFWPLFTAPYYHASGTSVHSTGRPNSNLFIYSAGNHPITMKYKYVINNII